jgi:hypothetical protein
MDQVLAIDLQNLIEVDELLGSGGLDHKTSQSIGYWHASTCRP